MDVTDWTDRVGQDNAAAQDEGVQPDSTMGGNAPCDPAVVIKSVQDDPPLEIAKTVEETEALSLDDVPLSERVRMINVTAMVETSEIQAKGEGSEGGPEVRASPVPAIVVSLPTVEYFRRKLYTTPPPKNDEESDDADTRPNGPVMRVTSETIVEVNRRGNDPRLGYGTPYFWKNRPDMQKYYGLQTEFPTLSGASKFGLNFATESEEERNR